MAGFRIEGDTSGNVVEVDSAHHLKTTLPLDPDYSGYGLIAGRLSEASDPAGIITEKIRVSTQGRLTVGQPTTLLDEVFNYTTLPTSIFTQQASSATVAAAGGTLNLNAGASTTSGHYARISTNTFFPFQADGATYLTMDALLTQPPQTGTLVEFGFGQISGTTAPSDGCFFRYNASAQLLAVISNNGSEITEAITSVPTEAIMAKYKIIVENDRALFYIDGSCKAEIIPPTGLGFPMYAQSQPVFARVYNTATPALANVLKIGYMYVGMQDAAGLGKDAGLLAAYSGRTGHQVQPSATAGGSTQVYSNNLAAGAGVTLSNTTTAAGTVGLGGQVSVQPVLTAGTDGILFSYQNPGATPAVPGNNLVIKGVRLQGVVTSTMTGGPVIAAYSLAFGHTGVSLATAETIGTSKSARRVALGIESYPVNANVGDKGGEGIYMPFNSPIMVAPGEYVQIAMKNLGTVTSAGVITVLASFDCYWE